MIGHMQNFLHAYWMINPHSHLSQSHSSFHFRSTCIGLILLLCCCPSHLPISTSEPLPHLHPNSASPPSLPTNASTLLSPLVPVVPSQTNGAHYSRSKNSRLCHLIYFSPPLRLFVPFFLSESPSVVPSFPRLPREGNE